MGGIKIQDKAQARVLTVRVGIDPSRKKISMLLEGGRKKPYCHTCGSPMAGHKRKNGLVVCPETATTTTTTTGLAPGTRITEEELNELVGKIPERGVWRRQNPNWADTPRGRGEGDQEQEQRSRIQRGGGSVVSTEPASSVLRFGDSHHDDSDGDARSFGSSTDDDETDEDDEDDKASVASGSSDESSTSLLDGVLAASEPLASLFAMPTHALPRVRNAADRHGLHVGLFRRPGWSHDDDDDSMDVKGKGKWTGSNTPSWWVVLGKNAQAVRHLMDISSGGNSSKTHKMPGTLSMDSFPTTTAAAAGTMSMMMAPKKCPPNYAYNRKRVDSRTGFVQLLLASIIGSTVVLYGLSFL